MTRQKWCIVQHTLYLLIKELYFCDWHWHRNKALFVCFKTGVPNPNPRLFADPQIEGITHYTLSCKVVCQQGALPPLDSPIISVSRIQNRPCRFYILTPEIKKAPSPSSKGMLTVLLYIYPKVAFLQYHVSVGCGVVSLTKGNSRFPTRHRLGTYAKSFRYILLRHPLSLSQLSEILWKCLIHSLLSFSTIHK